MKTDTNAFVLDHFFCKKLLQKIAYNLSGSISDLSRYQNLCKEQNLTYNSSNLVAIKDIYKFTPQIFLKAYLYAWQHPEEKVCLDIVEINRGNQL